jgi:hypothetical protein
MREAAQSNSDGKASRIFSHELPFLGETIVSWNISKAGSSLGHLDYQRGVRKQWIVAWHLVSGYFMGIFGSHG